MKKTCRYLIALITLLSCILPLPACAHKHSFGDWRVTKDATCTESGEEERVCACGEKEVQGIAELGHTTNNGTCSRCKEPLREWEIHYSDDPADSFIFSRYPFYGTFSNIENADSQLHTLLVIDADSIEIILLPNGNPEVKADVNTRYEITFSDDNGIQYNTFGIMLSGGDRIYLADKNILDVLEQNTKLSVFIREQREFGVEATYRFVIERGNFNSVYQELLQD